jgi:hypothetical protein
MSSSGEAKSSAQAPPRAVRAEAGAAVDGAGEAARGGKQATALLVLGMAGSGKTSFVQRLNAHLHMAKKPCYIINLDPAVSARAHTHVLLHNTSLPCHCPMCHLRSLAWPCGGRVQQCTVAFWTALATTACSRALAPLLTHPTGLSALMYFDFAHSLHVNQPALL